MTRKLLMALVLSSVAGIAHAQQFSIDPTHTLKIRDPIYQGISLGSLTSNGFAGKFYNLTTIGSVNASAINLTGTSSVVSFPNNASIYSKTSSGVATPLLNISTNNSTYLWGPVGIVRVTDGTASNYLQIDNSSSAVTGGYTGFSSSASSIKFMNPVIMAGNATITGSLTASNTFSMPSYALASFGPSGLLEPVISATESASKFTVRNAAGGTAIVASTRSSDSGNNVGAAIALSGYALNDNTSFAQEAHAGYLEARSLASTNATLGLEVATVRTGSIAPTIGPYTMIPGGLTTAYWATSGRDDVTNSFDSSAAFGIYRGSGAATPARYFKSGIVFDYLSLDPAYGLNALHMPSPYNIRWTGVNSSSDLTQHDALVINGTIFQANQWDPSNPYTMNFIRARASGADTQASDSLGVVNFYATAGSSPILRASINGVQVNTGRGGLNINSTNDAGTLDTVGLNSVANHSFGPSTANGVSLGTPGVPWSNVVASAITLSNSVTITAGSGAPTGDSAIGSLWLRTDGTPGATLYVKEAAGVSGWHAK